MSRMPPTAKAGGLPAVAIMSAILKIERYLESTLLRADAHKKEIETLCTKAIQYNFYGVCLNPYYVPLASHLLEGSSVELVTVTGFPLGAHTGYIKALEAEEALQNGADEIDMVLNIGALKNGDTQILLKEIKNVVSLGVAVKVILETGYLSPAEVKLACHCAVEGGARFVKTSTGFGPRGVSLDDVEFLHHILPPNIGIKAAGGINTAAFASDLMRAGAHRLGSSSAEKIVLEAKKGFSAGTGRKED